MHYVMLLTALCTAHLLSSTLYAQSEVKLTASDGFVFDEFGSSVSISGDYAIVGANEADLEGAAYLFRREGSKWIEQQKLTASDGGYQDFFGSSVSISGDYVIVGAPEKNSSVGVAYMFRREGGAWVEQQRLTALDGESNDEFGFSVSISDDYAIVGARGDDNWAGAAYVFRREEDAWIVQQMLTASDWEALDSFGWSVSINGDYAIVGASDENDDTGAVYVFKREGDVWTEHLKVTASDGAAEDAFGNDVAISGDYAIVGATGIGPNGAAYVYALESVATDVADGEELPSSVVLEQNFPNPFHPTTSISFALPHADVVSLRVYDVLGREVATLVNERRPAGRHTVTFEAGDLPNGVYIYQLTVGGVGQTRRMVLIR